MIITILLVLMLERDMVGIIGWILGKCRCRNGSCSFHDSNHSGCDGLIPSKGCKDGGSRWSAVKLVVDPVVALLVPGGIFLSRLLLLELFEIVLVNLQVHKVIQILLCLHDYLVPCFKLFIVFPFNNSYQSIIPDYTHLSFLLRRLMTVDSIAYLLLLSCGRLWDQ